MSIYKKENGTINKIAGGGTEINIQPKFEKLATYVGTNPSSEGNNGNSTSTTLSLKWSDYSQFLLVTSDTNKSTRVLSSTLIPIKAAIDSINISNSGGTHQSRYALGIYSSGVDFLSNDKIRLHSDSKISRAELWGVKDDLESISSTLENDTGWVSLVPYLCEGVTQRDASNSDSSIAIRRINNQVYCKGQVKITRALSQLSSSGNVSMSMPLFNVPEQFRPNPVREIKLYVLLEDISSKPLIPGMLYYKESTNQIYYMPFTTYNISSSSVATEKTFSLDAIQYLID